MRGLLFAVVLVGASCASNEPPADAPKTERHEPPASEPIPDDEPTLGEHDLVKLVDPGGVMGWGDILVIRDDGAVVAVEMVGVRMGNPNDPPPPPRVREGRLEGEELEQLRSLLADPAAAKAPADARDFSGSAHPPQRDLVMRTSAGVVRSQFTLRPVPGPLEPLVRFLERVEDERLSALPPRSDR